MPTLTKKGISPTEVIRYAKCQICKSEYTFKHGEPGVTFVSDQRDGNFYSFKCQVCGEQVTVDSLGNSKSC